MNNALVDFKEENYIFFSIGSFNYAFNAAYVANIMQLVELEYPESMPEYIAGLLEYNNQIIKVIDIRNVLRLEAVEYGLNSKIIIVKTKNDIFGIIIDEVKEIKRINKAKFNAPPYDRGKSYLEAIYTEKGLSATIINLENIENTIRRGKESNNSLVPSSTFLPKDLKSKETLHRRRLHYAKKMREENYELIKSQDTYITFLLEKNICCVKILHVAGFYKFESLKITKIPCTPDFIVGVVSLKGRYITVIDLLKYTEDKSIAITKDTNIIVIEHEDYKLGILANAIGETIDIEENILNLNSNKNGCLKECVINSTMHLFLDTKRIFEDEKLYVS